MIVTVVCDVLGEENNGTTIAAMNLIRHLRSCGHTVRVVCPDESRRGEKDTFVTPVYNLGIFNGYVAKNGVTPGRADKAVLSAAMEGADVVHVMTPFSLGGAAARMAHEKGIPLTAGFHCQAENITSHVFLMNSRLVNRTVYRVLNRRLYRYCDAIHYPTRCICEVFEQVVGPTPHHVISNGVSAMWHPGPGVPPAGSEGGFRILFTGRYSREKSHRILIDAAALSRHRDELRLIFAGKGPQEEAIRRRAKRRGIAEPVMKFYSREELLGVVNSAQLYVHPAEIEIEAISCLEAISCGLTPVISDSKRSATRFFARTPDNLFRCNDAADLARRIDYWIEHPQEREACSKAYLGYAEQFAFDHCMEQMEQMLAETAGVKLGA